ncbi:MAG: threonine/serine exporter family protein, partial [Oscillospiraceae bacterium]|nr:threonine/serine exporter family protein [Oscillospiraceae bacterium]
MNKQQLLNIASRLGNSMQKHGAETFRVEDSIARVLSALGATDVNVFVINSCFMVSMKSKEGSVASEIRRCTEKTPDLYIVPMGEAAQIKALALCEALRSEGFCALTDVNGRGLKAQMKYANKIGA